jgi:hypothetical protein
MSPFEWFKPGFLQVDNPKSPYYKYRSSSFKRQIAHRFKRDKLIHQFLSELYTYHHNDVKAVGYKVNYSQIRKYKTTISWLKQNDVKVIHLLRNNLLKRLVSHKIANTRNLCHSTESLEPIQVHIDPEILKEDFLRRQNRFAKYRNFFLNVIDVPYLEVEYELLISDYDMQIRKILGFIEIDNYMRLYSKFVKVNPDSLEDIIENYSEVKQALANTQFEKFFD